MTVCFAGLRLRCLLLLPALVACADAGPAETDAAPEATEAATPTTAAAAPALEPSASAAQPDLTIELGEQFVTPDGELAILGVVTNNEPRQVELTRLALLAFDTQSRPRALAALRSGPSRLAAGERVPFLAVADHNPGHVHWQTYQDSTFADRMPAAEIETVAPAELRFTPQGAPFVIGEIRNVSSIAQHVRLLFTLLLGSRVLTLSQLDTPIALESGARLGFTASDFPGFNQRASVQARDELEVELRLESAPSSAETLSLTVSVEVFHSVGSALLVRGSVSNQQTVSLTAPAVLAEIRLLNGELWTAGWTVLTESLAPGQDREFVLELPLDQALDLTQVELDLRAFGTKAGD